MAPHHPQGVPLLQLERLAVLIALIVIWNLAVKEGWINHVYSATALKPSASSGTCSPSRCSGPT
jgi:hypothetical protein